MRLERGVRSSHSKRQVERGEDQIEGTTCAKRRTERNQMMCEEVKGLHGRGDWRALPGGKQRWVVRPVAHAMGA